MRDGVWDIQSKIKHTRQWKYSPGVPIPELTELVAAAEDESDTWDTGDEESYQTNDGFG